MGGEGIYEACTWLWKVDERMGQRQEREQGATVMSFVFRCVEPFILPLVLNTDASLQCIKQWQDSSKQN